VSELKQKLPIQTNHYLCYMSPSIFPCIHVTETGR